MSLLTLQGAPKLRSVKDACAWIREADRSSQQDGHAATSAEAKPEIDLTSQQEPEHEVDQSSHQKPEQDSPQGPSGSSQQLA